MTHRLANKRRLASPLRAALILAAAGTLTLTACSSNSATEEPTSEATTVAILTGVGLQDSGLGRATQEAADSLEAQYGAEVDVQGNVTAEEWPEALRNYGSRGFDLVIANDILGQAGALEVGPEFPETQFVVINGFEAQAPNVSAVTFDWESGGYLAGLLGGIASESGILGGIGADETIIPIKGLMDGFAAGVKKVNPDAVVEISYTGNPFGDPIQATQQAQAVVGKGADVIFGVANNGQPGLFQAASDGGALAIGFGVDENDIAPETVVSSIMLDYVGVVDRIFERYQSGTLAPEVLIEGNEQNVWNLADSRGLLTPEQEEQVATEVAAAKAQ